MLNIYLLEIILLKKKIKVALTIDFEDYNYNFNRDYNNGQPFYEISEVERQYWKLKNIFVKLNAKATFFLVSKVTSMLSKNILTDLKNSYHLGCHSYEHLNLSHLNKQEFEKDTEYATKILEDIFQIRINYYRAPYFSAEKITEFFYEVLNKYNYKFSSSIRIVNKLDNVNHNGIKEIPLKAFGFGSKKYTIIGGTYFRVTHVNIIKKLIINAKNNNFTPMIYLHNYDVDYNAKPIIFSNSIGVINNKIRFIGRETVEKKLQILSKCFDFCSLDQFENKI